MGLLTRLSLVCSSLPSSSSLTTISDSSLEGSSGFGEDGDSAGFGPDLISNIRKRPFPRPTHISLRRGRIEVILVLLKCDIYKRKNIINKSCHIIGIKTKSQSFIRTHHMLVSESIKIQKEEQQTL